MNNLLIVLDIDGVILPHTSYGEVDKVDDLTLAEYHNSQVHRVSLPDGSVLRAVSKVIDYINLLTLQYKVAILSQRKYQSWGQIRSIFRLSESITYIPAFSGSGDDWFNLCKTQALASTLVTQQFANVIWVDDDIDEYDGSLNSCRLKLIKPNPYVGVTVHQLRDAVFSLYNDK